jgi:Zn-dependent protease
VPEIPVQSNTVCKRCSAELPVAAVVCNHCHALVHAEKLELLATGAKLLEEQGDLIHAKEQWLQGLALLPADSKQAAWIQDHARRLDLASSVVASQPVKKKSLGRFAPLAPILLALAKGKALLALLNLKFVLSLGAFVGVYWSLYGMWFGLGFAAQILVHELGHYIDIKRRGLPADLPVFLPGMGAYVRWQALGVPVETRAAVSLAGPLAGWVAAAGCTLMWFETGSGLWAALARSGAWLNLLNLIPVWGLDGGHAFLALTKKERVIVLTISLAALLVSGESVFLLILLGVTFRLFTKDFPDQPSRATVSYFVGVLSALAVLIWALPGRGFGTP